MDLAPSLATGINETYLLQKPRHSPACTEQLQGLRAEDSELGASPPSYPKPPSQLLARRRPGTCESRGTGEVRGGGCFPEGELFPSNCLSQRAKGRAGEKGLKMCACVSVCEATCSEKGKVVTRRLKANKSEMDKSGDCCETALILAA